MAVRDFDGVPAQRGWLSTAASKRVSLG